MNIQPNKRLSRVVWLHTCSISRHIIHSSMGINLGTAQQDSRLFENDNICGVAGPGLLLYIYPRLSFLICIMRASCLVPPRFQTVIDEI